MSWVTGSLRRRRHGQWYLDEFEPVSVGGSSSSSGPCPSEELELTKFWLVDSLSAQIILIHLKSDAC